MIDAYHAVQIALIIALLAYILHFLPIHYDR